MTTSSTPSLFTVEILRNKLLAIASEMGAALARASMSPIVYEVLDFACGICNVHGDVVAQDNGLCLFTGTFRPQVESILTKFPVSSMRPGDIYMTNSAYGGGTHNPDVALIQPIFAEGTLLAFAISVTHWTEIGGKVLGSVAPDATEVFQEGLQLPQLLLVRDGITNQAIVDIIAANVRLPAMSLGDMRAGIAAARIAERRLLEITDRYGVETLTATFAAILLHGETIARAGLATIPAGTYIATETIDGDGVSIDPIAVCATVTVNAEEFIVDFTGSAPQTAGPINCSRGALMSACKTIFKALIAPQQASNEGLFAPLTVVVPDGTVFSAVRPAATGWYYESTAFATELVWKALAPAMPHRLSAGSYLSLCAYYIGGITDDGDYWNLTTPQDGGWGACHDRDGESSLIATTDGDTYNYPAEVIEATFPVTVLRNAFNVEAGGGHGRFRGGFGTIREYRFEHPRGGSFQASLGRSVHVPWGIGGGEDGTPNYFEILRATGETERGGRVTNLRIESGDVIRVVTGNGGGWGDLRDRDPSAVAVDFANGLILPNDVEMVYRMTGVLA